MFKLDVQFTQAWSGPKIDLSKTGLRLRAKFRHQKHAKPVEAFLKLVFLCCNTDVFFHTRTIPRKLDLQVLLPYLFA